MNPVLIKASQVLAVAVFAFILGGLSFFLSGACTELIGGRWAWMALIASILGLVSASIRLLRDAAKPKGAE